MRTINNPFKKEKVYSSAQEEIAKTYFKTYGKDNNKKKPVRRIPWVIAAASILVVFFVLISKSNIDVKIDPATDKFTNARERGEFLIGEFLIKGSELNKYLIKNTAFLGDAKRSSAVSENELVFRNSRGSGWANYTIELKEPLDLSKLDIKYAAKGENGDEYLGIVIVDSDKRSYRIEKDISAKLTKDWQVYTINFRPIRNAVDLANIVTIKFQFGSPSAGNNSMATIFLKDVYVTKTKKMGWL